MNLVLSVLLLSLLSACLADEATVNATSNWSFPPGAQNSINLTNLKTSIEDYLRTAASQITSSGWASIAVHAGDRVNIQQRSAQSQSIELWCLNCWIEYKGTSGRDACDRYTKQSYLRHYDITTASGWNTVLQQGTTVSAGMCAYGFKGTTDVYDITVAYPYVYSSSQNDQDIIHEFSQAFPAGNDAAPVSATTLSTTTRATRTTRTTSTSRYGYPSSTYRPSYSSNSNKHNTNAGAIAGGVVGACAGLLLLIIFCNALRSAHKEHMTAKKPAHLQRNFRVEPYTRPMPTRRPIPAASPQRSVVEEQPRPAARRRDTDGDDLPPPAYEEVVVDTVRQADSGAGSAAGSASGQAGTATDVRRELPPLPGATTEESDRTRRRSSW